MRAIQLHNDNSAISRPRLEPDFLLTIGFDDHLPLGLIMGREKLQVFRQAIIAAADHRVACGVSYEVVEPVVAPQDRRFCPRQTKSIKRGARLFVVLVAHGQNEFVCGFVYPFDHGMIDQFLDGIAFLKGVIGKFDPNAPKT